MASFFPWHRREWTLFLLFSRNLRKIHRPTTPAIPRSRRVAGTAIPPGDENVRVDLGRIAWVATVLACLIAVVILLLQGYYGYASVTFAVAVSAGINLT